MELLILPFVVALLIFLTGAVNKSLYEHWRKDPPKDSLFCTINHKQVHVRLFGESYLSGVDRTLRRVGC